MLFQHSDPGWTWARKAKRVFKPTVLMCLAIGCANSFKQPTEPTIHLPIPSLTFTPSRTPIIPGDSVLVEASVASGALDVGYAWRLLSSEGLLFDADSARAIFVPLTAGEFVLSARTHVEADSSEPQFLTIPVPQVDATQAPTAVIVASDTVLTVGESMTLDGSQSHDPQGQPLTFRWRSLNGGQLSATSDPITTFRADTPGRYTILLTVSDGAFESSPALITIVFLPGSPPVIDIKPFRTNLEPNEEVTLDASESFDPDGHGITFSWQSFNGGTLSSARDSIVTFASREAGTFVIYLRVQDDFAFFSDTTLNVVVGEPGEVDPPVACLADSEITTRVQEPVTLDASCSHDPQGKALTYEWQVAGEEAVVRSDSPLFEFVADEAGVQVVVLVVRNDMLVSQPVFATITVSANQLPVAGAGDDQSLRFGRAARLDGSGSFDPEGARLTFLWQPLNGGRVDNPNAETTAFSAAEPGTYAVSLIVNDGIADSEPDVVNITLRSNGVPVADAGPGDTTRVGESIVLSGAGSHDPDNDAITFLWQPLNGGTVDPPDAREPMFTAELPGTYTISLTVFDSLDASAPAFVNIAVVDGDGDNGGQSPIADAGPDVTYLLGDTDRATLDGSASSDPDGDALTFYWQGVATNPQVFDPDSVERPSFAIISPGIYVFVLTVFDGTHYSKPDDVVITIESPDLFVSTSRTGPEVHPTITSALDAAQPGFLIFVEPDIYRENVSNFISGVTLLSTEPERTIIDGGGNASALFLRDVSGVKIKGFTIRAGGGVDPSEIDVGNIACLNASNIIIEKNRIVESFGDGIRLVNSQNITIRQSDIIDNSVNGIRSTLSSFEVISCEVRGHGAGRPETTGGISIEGENAASLTVEIRNSTFRDNEDNHIQCANNSSVLVEENSFTGIGGGIFCTSNSGVSLFVQNNEFVATTGAPIFALDKAILDVNHNILDNRGETAAPGIDLINMSGDFVNNEIMGYSIGIQIRTSPVLVSENTFINNDIDIKVRGDGNCPTVVNNQPAGGLVLDYLLTDCPPPGNR